MIANFDFKLDFRFDFYENDHLLKIFRLIRKNIYHIDAAGLRYRLLIILLGGNHLDDNTSYHPTPPTAGFTG